MSHSAPFDVLQICRFNAHLLCQLFKLLPFYHQSLDDVDIPFVRHSGEESLQVPIGTTVVLFWKRDGLCIIKSFLAAVFYQSVPFLDKVADGDHLEPLTDRTSVFESLEFCCIWSVIRRSAYILFSTKLCRENHFL